MLKDKLILNKDFVKSMLAIALPLALQNIINFGVQAMDSIMLGRLGDTAISAATLGGQPFFILSLLGFGLSGGGSVLIAQYWGKKNIEVIKKVMRVSMLCITIASATIAVICFFFPENIMSLFSNDEVIINASASYLKVLSLGFLAYSIGSNYLLSMRAVEKVKMSTFVYAMSFFVNVFFNYIFIFGAFGAPRLEIVGAAVGTVIARFFELICVLIYMYFIEKDIGFKAHCMFKIDTVIIKDYITNALPVIGNEMIWALGTTAMTMVMGRLGAVFVAANSVSMIIFNLASVAVFGIANAAAVLSGKTIGEGDFEKAQRVANTIVLITFCLGLVGTVLILLIREPFLSIYNLSPEAKEMAKQMMFVMALLQPLGAMDVVNEIGILRGGADTKFALIVCITGMWLINIPLGVVTGLVLRLSGPLVFLSMRIDCFYKIPLQLYRIFTKKWIRVVTKDDFN